MFKSPEKQNLSDTKLLALFEENSIQAWHIFCEKHSDFIYSVLRRMGFDYDGAMERFVYVCEKLCEEDFRRLKSVKYTGDEGDLTPWLRQVIKNLCVNWAWSENGRKRLLGFVTEMSEREQRVFQLNFWQGKTPFEIYELLRLEHDRPADIGDVFDALEKINKHLSQKKIWRLISGLSKTRKKLSLDKTNDKTGLKLEPVDLNNDNPEESLQKKESLETVKKAFESLPVREKLVIQFRYDDALTFTEIAEMLGWEKREATNLHKSAIYKLRKLLK
jgi:RNA polymerase sigma factor (sigma-70 family)